MQTEQEAYLQGHKDAMRGEPDRSHRVERFARAYKEGYNKGSEQRVEETKCAFLNG